MKRINFKIYEEELNNGFKIIFIPMDRKVVTVHILYKVGSRNEIEGKRGISHLLEHMMFKGTKKLKPEEYSGIVQKMGGVDNAFTTEDFTLYYSTIPSENLFKILEMEADRMVNCVFNEFESEKKVIIEERKERTENSPFGRFWENLSLLSYTLHPYRYPVIGFEKDLLNIKKKDIKDWYKKYYTPSNSFMVISGGFDRDKTFEKIKEVFGKINKKGEKINEHFYEPEQEGERRMIIKENGFLKILGITFQIPSFSDKEFLPLSMISNILGGSESSRLNKRLVLEMNLCNQVGIYCEEKMDKGLFIFYALLNKDAEFEKVIEIFWNEMQSIKKGEIKKDEMERVKNMLYSSFLYRMQSTQGRAFLISHFELHGDCKRVFKYLEEIDRIKPDDLVEATEKYLKKERSNTLILC